MSSMSTTSIDDHEYLLGRSFSASSRLNLQHYLWKDVVGYNIDPKIPLRNRDDFRIADVGTGTGIWLIDLNHHLPLAKLDGFDVSAQQYPPKEWLPAEISLKTLDITKPIPPELRGKYDLVHLRLFIAVVRNDDPSPILKNIMDMLKPGGYLQWSEHNLTTISVESIQPGTKTGKMESLIDHARNSVQCSWPPKLPDYLAKQGFESVSYNRYPVQPELRMLFTQMQFMVAEEHSFSAMDNSNPQARGPVQRRRIQEAANEATKGAGMHFILEVTVGKKPA